MTDLQLSELMRMVSEELSERALAPDEDEEEDDEEVVFVEAVGPDEFRRLQSEVGAIHEELRARVAELRKADKDTRGSVADMLEKLEERLDARISTLRQALDQHRNVTMHLMTRVANLEAQRLKATTATPVANSPPRPDDGQSNPMEFP